MASYWTKSQLINHTELFIQRAFEEKLRVAIPTVGLPNLIGLSKEKLREAVWKERWYKLSFENKTWSDMVRLRKALNVTTKTFENYVGHKFSYGPVLKERELLFPIPTAEIRNNTKLKQNSGY